MHDFVTQNPATAAAAACGLAASVLVSQEVNAAMSKAAAVCIPEGCVVTGSSTGSAELLAIGVVIIAFVQIGIKLDQRREVE